MPQPTPAPDGLRFDRRFWRFLGLAIALRLAMVPNQSWDYQNFLRPWYDHIQAAGGWAALKTGYADYTPPICIG